MQVSMKVCYKLILWFLMGLVKHSRSSQNSKFAMSLHCRKKELRDENGFLHADELQSFLQVILTLWLSKFSTRWYYHNWLPWSNILKVRKVTSLQYLFTISKKNLGIKVCPKHPKYFYFDAKHLDILRGFSHVYCYLSLIKFYQKNQGIQ